jgi:DNA-binding IscR family transcriptional regulator
MADDLDGWVSRAKIGSKFKGKPSTLNNAIKALRDRHVIWSKEGEKGVYRLQHKGFALWIKLYAAPDVTERMSQQQQTPNGQSGPKTPPTVQ